MLLDFNLNSASKRNSNHCAWWPSPTFYVHISQWKNFINSNFLTEKVCEQKQFGYSPNLNYQVFGEIRLQSLQTKNAKLFAFEYTLFQTLLHKPCISKILHREVALNPESPRKFCVFSRLLVKICVSEVFLAPIQKCVSPRSMYLKGFASQGLVVVDFFSDLKFLNQFLITITVKKGKL